MAEYEVRFRVRVPDGIQASDEQVQEWLRFNCRDNAEMRNDNPLAFRDPEPVRGSFDVRRSA